MHPWTRLAHHLSYWRRSKQRLRAVRELRRSFGLIADPQALETSIVARIRELFDPDVLVIFQADRATESFLPTHTSGVTEDEENHFSFAAKGRLARWFRVNESCLVLPQDEGVKRYLDPEEKQQLDRLRARLCAPIIALNQLEGIIVLGGTKTAWYARRTDAELLLRLAGHASLALQNAVLYREQREHFERLHRAERLASVGQLAAGVAHEIRNPLTSIRSTMQYLTQNVPEADSKRELLEGLLGEVDRIDSTVSGLLDLAREGELNPSEVDPAQLLERTLKLVASQARAQGVEIVQRFQARCHRLYVDVDQLKQVLLNLLLNALQAMPEGGTIILGATGWSPSFRKPAGQWLQIQVTDNGPGIPREHLRKVFDPFFTTKAEGTGLGLALCHRIIERHGGELHLESHEGKGTSAFIRLPLQIDT